MLRLTPTAEELHPAPLIRTERVDAAIEPLRAHGIHPRRLGHASSVGITITYLHLSEAADGPAAVRLLAAALDWADTDMAEVAGTVAITTTHG
jgi:hypothetical protein